MTGLPSAYLGRSGRSLERRFARAAVRLARRSRHARGAAFDIAPGDPLLLSHGDPAFVVAAGDRVIGKEVFVNGGFGDVALFETVQRLVGRSFADHTLFDIGANIGVICLPLLRTGAVADAVAGEPDPLNHRLPCANIALNGLTDRVVAHRAALAQPGCEIVRIQRSDWNFGDHQMIDATADRADPASPDFAPAMTLDALTARHAGRPPLIWMHTQGFEGFILQGGRETMARRPPMVIEFWPDGLGQDAKYAALLESLTQSPYDSFIDLGAAHAPQPLEAQRLEALFRKVGSGAHTDLLLH